MPLSIIFITLSTSFLCGSIILLTIRYRNMFQQMTGMMAAMTLGMMTGLLYGIILAIILSGDLFLSTVLGMGIGMIIGGAAGISLSITAFLDGLLSGLMGGMMGAMLGVMIVPEFQEILIKVLFVISTGVLVTLIYMIFNEINTNEHTGIKKFLFNPWTLLIMFIIFFFSFNSMDKISLLDENVRILNWTPMVQNHSKMNSEHGTEQNSKVQEQIYVINADEFSYSPQNLQIPKGEEVTIVLRNIGEVEHDIQVDGLKVDILEIEFSNHKHVENSTFHIHAPPKTETKLVLKIRGGGKFQYFCTIPGHKEAGMLGTLEVF